MSKLYYRLNSLCTYLKCHKLLDESFEPLYFKSKSDSEIIEEYVKCFSLLDYSYNVPFNDKYKEFIDEYEEELLNIHKRNIATKAKEKLMAIFYKSNKPPISDAYIYEHIELTDDLKPYLNLKMPPPNEQHKTLTDEI
jgi:hypothetical protein